MKTIPTISLLAAFLLPACGGVPDAAQPSLDESACTTASDGTEACRVIAGDHVTDLGPGHCTVSLDQQGHEAAYCAPGAAQ